MKKFIPLLLLFCSFYGIAQQGVNKTHYKIINPDFEFTLNYEKALSHLQVDGLRFMNERRQIAIEGTSIKVELYSAQELLIAYGKPISPLTIKNPSVAPSVALKLSENNYSLLITPALPINQYASIQTDAPQTITDFGSALYDSGNQNGAYLNNETYVRTIYSDNGESPYLNFTSFSTEANFDVMYIYDGANASSRLIGEYTGGNSPQLVKATGAYLTVVFTSDGSKTSSGWSAMVGRGTPPPPPSPMSAPTCAQADPFCTGTTYNFPATVGGRAGQSGPSYGCLYSQPNPAWYYLQIANSGPLTLNIAGSGGYDVDFICWGPFTSPTGACTAGLVGSCTGNHSCAGGIVDCSYSTSATESCSIPNAIAGQYYMVLITNFSNQAQNIVFNQTGGAGSTNCSIVAPCTVSASNTGPYCIGQTISVAATSTATGTYNWTGPSGYSATGQSPTRGGATAAMSGTYTVVLTSGSNTCTATTAVTVSGSPTVSATSAAICAGNSANLTASGATNYTWTTGGSPVSNTANLTASPAVTTSYNVLGAVGTCTASTVATITVNPKPTVTATGGTICLGGTTTLTASGATNYTWSPTTGLTPSNGIGASVVASPAATTNYIVTGANATGCTNTVSVAVTVNPLPTITVPAATICSGTSTNLTASGASTYTWSPAATLTPSVGTTVSANPTSTQTYTITGTSAAGCTNSVTAVVTVNALPVITVNSPTICTGGTAAITASGASSYAWNPGGAVSASINVSPTASQTYQVVGTTSTCTSTATSTVIVVSNPVITVSSATICTGGTVTLTASGGSGYTWGPSASLSSPTGASVNAFPTSTTVYNIVGSVGTCTASGTATVTVNPLPTITATSSTICVGQQTATLTASGGTSYTWSPSASLSPSATSNPVLANPTTTQTYVVTGIDINGCINIGTSTVTVNPLPIITATSATICVGQQTATLTAGGGVSYLWSDGSTTPSVTESPVSTQSYVVTGTDANGCTNTYTTTVTVNSLPLVTASSTTVCSGFPGTITAGGANTYTWSTTPVTTGSSLTQSPISTTNYNVTGTDGNGCTNTAVGTIAVYSAFTISANSATICAAGQQIATLTATGAATYTWTPATGLSANTGSAVTTTPVATTTVYTIVGVSAVGGCAAVTTASLTVNALPQPIATSNTPCTNQQALTFNCTPTGLANYAWAGPNNYSDSGPNPSVPLNLVTPALSGIYTVTVTDNNTPACTNTAVVNVVVNPLPLPTANAAPVCVGQTINLMATGGVAYSWAQQPQQTGSFTSSLQNPQRPNADPTMDGIYVVTVTDANGCLGTAVATVTVNPLPVVTITSNNICIGQQTATLTASGASTYVWTGSSLVSTTDNPVNANPVATSTYNVIGTDVNSCVGTATTVVVVSALPTVAISPVKPDCIPLFAAFTATCSPPAAPGGYNWNFGNGQTSTAQSPSTTYTLAGTSLVTLTITDTNHCVNSATTNVTAFAIPTADFDYGTKPVSVLAPEVQFYNESTPGLNYNWNFGDTYNNTDSTTNPNHTYSAAGTYTVTLSVSSANGCKASIENLVVIQDDYVLYVPNAFSPNDDGTNEIFKPVGEGIATYKMFIFDRWGNLIFYSEDMDKGWDGTYQTKGGDVVQQDVYVWKIQLKNILNVSKDLTGTVTLLK